jgi:hypothetical protein
MIDLGCEFSLRQSPPGSLPLFGVFTLVVWLRILVVLLLASIHLFNTRVHMVTLHCHHRSRPALALIRLPMANALYWSPRRPPRSALSEAESGLTTPESRPRPTTTTVVSAQQMKLVAFSLSWSSAQLGGIKAERVCSNRATATATHSCTENDIYGPCEPRLIHPKCVSS